MMNNNPLCLMLTINGTNFWVMKQQLCLKEHRPAHLLIEHCHFVTSIPSCLPLLSVSPSPTSCWCRSWKPESCRSACCCRAEKPVHQCNNSTQQHKDFHNSEYHYLTTSSEARGPGLALKLSVLLSLLTLTGRNVGPNRAKAVFSTSRVITAENIYWQPSFSLK